MTLSPYESRRIKAAEGGPYPLNDTCQHPDCNSRFVEHHHLERRSSVGDTWWVEVEGQGKFPNIINLCNEHHRQITDNEARIWWDEDMKCFQWVEFVDGAGLFTDPLDPQPGPYVIVGTMEGSTSVEPTEDLLPGEIDEILPRSRRMGLVEEVMPSVGLRSSQSDLSVTAPAPGKECSTCGRRVPYPKKEKSPVTVTTSFRVPADMKEAHKETWEALAEHLGTREKPHWQYATLTHAAAVLFTLPEKEVRDLFDQTA